jgi:hypothetical protein
MSMITDEAGFLLESKLRKHIDEVPANSAGQVDVDSLLETLGVTDGLGFEALLEALDPASDIELRAKGLSTGTSAGKEKSALPLLVSPDDCVRRLRAFVEAENAAVQVRTLSDTAEYMKLSLYRRAMQRRMQMQESGQISLSHEQIERTVAAIGAHACELISSWPR